MKLKNLLPLIGILIFVYIIYKIGLNKILVEFTKANLFYILIATLIIPLGLLVQTVRWGYLLKKQGFNLGLWYLLKIQTISMFYGAVTPGRVGSLIKAFYIKNKINKSLGEASSSVIVERVLDFLTVFLFALIGCLLIINYFSNLFIPILLAFIFFILLIFFFSSRKRIKWLFRITYKLLFFSKLKENFRKNFYSFYSSMPSYKVIFITFLFTIFLWLIFYTQTYIAAIAFSIDVPYIYFVTIFAISTIISLIPITIAGFGTREATLIALLGIFSITPEQIVAMSVVWVAIATIIIVIIGGFFALTEKL